MTTNNSTSPTAHQSSASLYQLPESRRQAILTHSDNPAGRISGAWLRAIGRQRFKFIQMNDCDGTETSA